MKRGLMAATVLMVLLISLVVVAISPIQAVSRDNPNYEGRVLIVAEGGLPHTIPGPMGNPDPMPE
ncbi:hypothetical protein [Alkaliphilus crotonatoxidans]